MNRIRSLRDEKGVKQADLAKFLQVSRASLSGYETGNFEAPLSVYISIADYFSVSLDYLLGRTDEKKPVPVRDELSEKLTESERELLTEFRFLNDEGQLSALAMIRGLASTPAYIKSDLSGALQKEIG